MLPQFQEKTVVVSPPQSLADNSTLTCATVDTIGYEYAEFITMIGVTANALSAHKIQQSDQSNMASPADISGTVMGTDNNDTGSASTLPSATDDNKAFQTLVDLRGKKRYLKPSITTPVSANNTCLISVVCKLSRPHEAPNTAAGSGTAPAQRMIG
jgi:hypothetical protein